MNTATPTAPKQPITIALLESVDFDAMARASDALGQTLEEFTADAITRHLETAKAVSLVVTLGELCQLDQSAQELQAISGVVVDHVRAYVESLGEQADDSVTSTVSALEKLIRLHAESIEEQLKEARANLYGRPVAATSENGGAQ